MLYSLDIPVFFGDCDPAGIVFYPNYLRWVDACFQTFLRSRIDGGHDAACKALGAMGIGVMEEHANYRSSARDGQVLTYSIHRIEWGTRNLQIYYSASEGDRLCIEGRERRGLFVIRDGQMAAAEVAPLRDLLGLT